MTKEKRLGRGLEALLGQLPGWNGASPPAQAGTPLAAAAAPQGDDAGGPATIPIRPLESTDDVQPPAGRHAKAISAEGEPNMGPMRLDIDSLKHNPHQPRQEFDADELQRLADSIRDARPAPTGRSSAVAGRISTHRRRASLAGGALGRMD